MEPTRAVKVLHPAQYVLKEPTLSQEPVDALRVPEDSTQVVRREHATPALQEAMRQGKGQEYAEDAQPKPILRREVIGATIARPEVALLDLAPNRPANFVRKGFILPPSMQNPAHLAQKAKLPE